MTLDQIKNHLQYAVPEELYQIKKGQVVLFTPKDGIDQRTALNVFSLFRYFRHLDKDNNIKMIFVPTDNELLIGAIAGRSPFEIDVPRVFIGTWDTVAGFAAGYFNEEIDEIIEKQPRMSLPNPLSITKDLPVIVTINPANCPIKEPDNEPSHFSCPFMDGGSDGLGMLLAKPEPGSSTERKLILKEENKLEKILRECAVLGIELDIDKVRKKVEDDLNKKVDYKLRLDIQFKEKNHWPTKCTVCDIYVAEGEEYKLDLTAIEKAVYLSFLLFENGITVLDAYDNVREITKKIYVPLPEKNEKDSGGITDDSNMTYDAYIGTLRGILSDIRAAVAEKVSNPIIAQEFCIEGFKKSPYGIERTTAELREQIRREFHLD